MIIGSIKLVFKNTMKEFRVEVKFSIFSSHINVREFKSSLVHLRTAQNYFIKRTSKYDYAFVVIIFKSRFNRLRYEIIVRMIQQRWRERILPRLGKRLAARRICVRACTRERLRVCVCACNLKFDRAFRNGVNKRNYEV